MCMTPSVHQLNGALYGIVCARTNEFIEEIVFEEMSSCSHHSTIQRLTGSKKKK